MARVPTALLTLAIAPLAALPGLGLAAECPCPAADVVICGHRGTGTNVPGNPFPENTIPSLQQAVEEGATMVELDVSHSADGALVVIHDDTVDRTTDGTGCVGELALAELQGLDAAVGTPLEGTGVTIPTLGEVLDALDATVNVEIKMTGGGCPPADRAKLAADVVAAIAAHPDSAVIVSSFDIEVLLLAQALDSELYLGLIGVDLATDLEVAADAGLAAVHPLFLGVLPEGVQAAHALGLDVNPWTVDDALSFGSVLDAGVDAIITDEPDKLTSFIGARCAEWTCEPQGEDAGAQEDAGGTDAADAASEDAASEDAAAADAGGDAADDATGTGTEDTGATDAMAQDAAAQDAPFAVGDAPGTEDATPPASGGNADAGCGAARATHGGAGVAIALLATVWWRRRRAAGTTT